MLSLTVYQALPNRTLTRIAPPSIEGMALREPSFQWAANTCGDRKIRFVDGEWTAWQNSGGPLTLTISWSAR